MTRKTILISINSAWNIINFRWGLIRALQGAGYRVIALAPDDGWGGHFAELGVEFHPIEMDKKGVSPRRDARLLRRYYKSLKALRPDVFLGFTAKPNVYGSLAAQRLGIKVINNVSGLGTAFIRENLLTRIVSTLYRIAFRRSATVFFQNDDDRSLFIAKKLVGPGKAQLLPGSGIDLRHFRPPSAAAPERGFTFLLVARLLWDKGVGEYVGAARSVRADFPNARFQMLGFLDVENRSAVRRKDVETWVSEGIIDYLGIADDVRPAMAGADCIVLPSYREGLPRTLLEGAAMGRPLIATDVPGCRQVVKHGDNGFLCQIRDAESLAEAMRRLIALPAEERELMGRRGRQMVEAEFDERLVHQHYLTAIERALDRGNAG